MDARFGNPIPAVARKNGDDRFKPDGQKYREVELNLIRRAFGHGSIIASHFLKGSPLRDAWLEGTVVARFVQEAYSSRTPLCEIWLTLGDFRIDVADAREFMLRREVARAARDGPGLRIADKFEYGGQKFRLGQELIDFLKTKLAKEGIIQE